MSYNSYLEIVDIVSELEIMIEYNKNISVETKKEIKDKLKEISDLAYQSA